MAGPNERPRLISRSRRMPQQYVQVPDAVNETLRASGVAQRMEAQRVQVEAKQKQQEAQARQKAQARTSYRNRKKAQQDQARQSGQVVFELPVEFMSDQAVDAAIAQEQRDAQFRANQPQLSQGYDRPRVDTNRLADQYATVSNFYASLGSPNMMPMNTAQVQANPNVAAQQLDFGLNNPALTVLQIATPTGPSTGAFGAAKTAFKEGMQAARPLATKVVAASGQAVKAGGQAVVKNAPRLVGNAVVLGVPAAAQAAEVMDESQNAGGDSGSAMPWIIGSGATILGGTWLYNKFRKGASPNWLTWWERNPNTVAADARFGALSSRYNKAFTAGDQAAMDALKTELGKSPQATITQGTGKRAKTVDNPDFISNTELGTMIQNRSYPTTEGFIIEPKSSKYWRGFRNWGIRFPIYSIVAGNVGRGVYDWMSGPQPQGDMNPTREEYAPNYQETDDAVQQGDTVVAVPRSNVPDTVPVTTGGIVWSANQ